jgi:hypothetical protein
VFEGTDSIYMLLLFITTFQRMHSVPIFKWNQWIEILLVSGCMDYLYQLGSFHLKMETACILNRTETMNDSRNNNYINTPSLQPLITTAWCVHRLETEETASSNEGQLQRY